MQNLTSNRKICGNITTFFKNIKGMLKKLNTCEIYQSQSQDPQFQQRESERDSSEEHK